MTAHRLAQHLLTQPDLPVVINGWGSDESMGPYEVTKTTFGEAIRDSNRSLTTRWPETTPVLRLDYN